MGLWRLERSRKRRLGPSSAHSLATPVDVATQSTGSTRRPAILQHNRQLTLYFLRTRCVLASAIVPRHLPLWCWLLVLAASAGCWCWLLVLASFKNRGCRAASSPRQLRPPVPRPRRCARKSSAPAASVENRSKIGNRHYNIGTGIHPGLPLLHFGRKKVVEIPALR